MLPKGPQEKIGLSMSDQISKALDAARHLIQGFLLYPYSEHQFAHYQPFIIDDPAAFRQTLNHQLDENKITSANWKREARHGLPLNVAFTASGLKKLLGAAFIEESYDRPFAEGMATTARARKLGDVGPNEHGAWSWGAENKVDGVYLAFGATTDEADASLAFLNGSSGATPLASTIVGDLKPTSPHTGDGLEGKELFGFADGVSQPVIIGTRRYKNLSPAEKRLHGIPAGELILGFPDGTDRNWEDFAGTEKLPRSPYVPREADQLGLLAPSSEAEDCSDFGRFGSYLVLRQIEQDYDKFWTFAQNNASSGRSEIDTAELLVGRRMDGTPLGLPPEGAVNDFDFSDDVEGMLCPIGSHVRRTNPRSFGEAGKNGDQKLRVTNRHRIARRGRIYLGTDNKPRGLLFACLNTSITRQFEFIQATWCNDPFFGGLEREVDPIIGTVNRPAKGLPSVDRFSIAAQPCRDRIAGLTEFTRVKGGGYFFIPSLAALKVLASLPV